MSKPKSSIRDYGYNPNQYDSIEDMMNSVPDATVTNQGVIRKHSEFQSPNESDDYMKMDTSYDPFPGSPDWKGPYPDAGKYREDYAESCLQLWQKLFPDWESGARAMNQVDMVKYRQYAAKCPTDLIWMKCCAKDKTNYKGKNEPASKISGPDTVNHDDTKEYKLVPPLPAGCGEWWGADYGRCVGGTYTAPSSGTTDRIYVDPLIPEAGVKHCAEKKIKLVASGTCASESIGISGTTQMSVGDTKTLTVLNSVVGKTYTWVISSGGGSVSPSTGTSTTYTAPASNANCLQNPTIQLKVGANVCDTTSFAVNNPTETGAAAYYQWYRCDSAVACSPPQPGRCMSCLFNNNVICTGVATETTNSCMGSNCEYLCSNPLLAKYCTDHPARAVVDRRTPTMKTNGCCPYQLL